MGRNPCHSVCNSEPTDSHSTLRNGIRNQRQTRICFAVFLMTILLLGTVLSVMQLEERHSRGTAGTRRRNSRSYSECWGDSSDSQLISTLMTDIEGNV